MNYKTYYKTVAILIDDLPNFDKAQALRLRDFLASNGYNAVAVDCKEVADKSFKRSVSILILPQCESVPSELMKPIRDFVGWGRSLLCLGGPLFYDNIVSEEGKYVIKELPENTLDATFLPENGGFVLEGIAPSYKVYKATTESFVGSDSFGAFEGLKVNERIDLLCPAHRNHGAGHFERRERFIPLVYGADSLNTAAYFMLTSEAYGGHDAVSPRPGYVVPTTYAHSYGAIGIRRADILSVEGADKLILTMLERFSRGLWLFEAGIDRFRPKHGERVKLGGSVMNSSIDYKTVEVEFRVGGEVKYSERLVTAPQGFTDFECEVETDRLLGEDGELICTLRADGEVVDELVQEIKFKPTIKAARSEFVTVENGRFMLGGKPWQAVGMNYWPSYYPSLEVVDYWRGWLNTASYDPKIIEYDLTKMEELGINCLLTRLDTFEFKCMKEPLSDFIERMRAHNMKLGLAVTMIESPPNYHPDAFRELIEKNALADEPVLFAHDVCWEVGAHFISGYKDSYTEEWNAWVNTNYGSIENAVADWGYSPAIVDGVLATPDYACFKNDGEHRVCTAAFRRFMDEHIGRIWLDAVSNMRSVDPNHLYTYRQGAISCYDLSYTATHVSTDFICPEAYHLKENEDGYANACFSTEYLRTLSGGQPIFWAEYGKSLCGLRWTKLIWDHDGFGFYDESLVEMSRYLSLLHRMLESVHVEGSAPWWWCGGFRRTEMSDFGYLSPAGELRPCALEYGEVTKRLSDSERRTPTRYITVDRDADARGIDYICSVIGTEAWHGAEAEGEYLGVKLDGEGVDTATLSELAVGNVPFNGSNPHKYLSSLFKSARVEDGKLCIEFYNTNVANWLAENTYIKVVSDGEEVLCPIEADTPRLAIAKAKLGSIPSGKLKISMYTDAAGEFGERYELEL